MKEIERLLPGYNCGECGFKSCREFARALLKGTDRGREIEIELCPHLGLEKHREKRAEIEETLPRLPKAGGRGARRRRGEKPRSGGRRRA